MAKLPPLPVTPPAGAPPPPSTGRTMFCWRCGAQLQIPVDFKGSGGPCPQCATWLAMPAAPAGPHQSLPSATIAAPPAPAAGEPPPEAAAPRARQRLRPDITVDFDHAERRETMHTLRMMGGFLLAAGICAAVAYFVMR